MPQDAPTRITEDANGPRSTYDRIEVGADLGTIEWIVTKDLVDVQCHLDQDFDEWYSLSSPYGGVIAPPQIQYRPPRWLLSRNFNIRGLFYKWEMENCKPVVVGAKLLISGRIAEKYVRKDREFVVYEAEATDESGNVIFRTRRTHVLDALLRSVPRVGTGIDSGIKSEKI